MLLLAPRSHWWVVSAYSPLLLHNACSTQGIFSGTYGKILKKKPRGLYFFKGPFLGASFWRGLCSVGYVQREICVSKSIRLAYSWKEIYRFLFVLLCI